MRVDEAMEAQREKDRRVHAQKEASEESKCFRSKLRGEPVGELIFSRIWEAAVIVRWINIENGRRPRRTARAPTPKRSLLRF